MQQGEDCSVLLVSDISFKRPSPAAAGEKVIGALDEIPQIFMEAKQQEGKQERRGEIYYSRGHLLHFSVCLAMSFPFPPAT